MCKHVWSIQWLYKMQGCWTTFNYLELYHCSVQLFDAVLVVQIQYTCIWCTYICTDRHLFLNLKWGISTEQATLNNWCNLNESPPRPPSPPQKKKKNPTKMQQSNKCAVSTHKFKTLFCWMQPAHLTVLCIAWWTDLLCIKLATWPVSIIVIVIYYVYIYFTEHCMIDK